MRKSQVFLIFLGLLVLNSCKKKPQTLSSEVFQSFATGGKNVTDIAPEDCRHGAARMPFVRLVSKMKSCEALGEIRKYEQAKGCLEAISGLALKTYNVSKGCFNGIQDFLKVELISYATDYHKNYVVGNEDDMNYNFGRLRKYWQLSQTWYEGTEKSKLYKKSEKYGLSIQQIQDFKDEIYNNALEGIQKTSAEWKKILKTEEGEGIFETILCSKVNILKTLIKEPTKRFICESGSQVPFDGELSLDPNLKSIILADTWGIVNERIESLSRIYDISCKLKKCPEKFPQSTILHTLLEFFAGIEAGKIPTNLMTSGNVTTLDFFGSFGAWK